MLPDGRVRAIVDNPGRRDTFLVFVRSGERCLVDEFINVTESPVTSPVGVPTAVGTPTR